MIRKKNERKKKILNLRKIWADAFEKKSVWQNS